MRAQQRRAVIYLAPGDLDDMAVATSTFEWHSGFVEGDRSRMMPRISPVQEEPGQTQDELSPSALDQIASFSDFAGRNATFFDACWP